MVGSRVEAGVDLEQVLEDVAIGGPIERIKAHALEQVTRGDEGFHGVRPFCGILHDDRVVLSIGAGTPEFDK